MIIKRERSIIPGLDVDSIERVKEVVSKTCSVEGIGAYKIGFQTVIPYGMKRVVEEIRALTDLPIIYDHQKAGTDIPEMGHKFFSACKGVDAVILFPVMGPVTEKLWIRAAREASMPVIIGGEMTHKGYLFNDGGYLRDDAPDKIYSIAASLGVIDFVVPGNKPSRISHYSKLLKKSKPVFYSPGLVTQGGSISESGKAAGPFWHAIVGRALYNADDITSAAKEMVKEIV